MSEPERINAVCGLECHRCDLYRAGFDREAAERLAGWWRSEGWLAEGEGADKVMAMAPHCLGCRGDREKHWSPTCHLLKCCMDDKGLSNCAECDEFGCEALTTWAQGNDKYAGGLGRLEEMRRTRAVQCCATQCVPTIAR